MTNIKKLKNDEIEEKKCNFINYFKIVNNQKKRNQNSQIKFKRWRNFKKSIPEVVLNKTNSNEKK